MGVAKYDGGGDNGTPDNNGGDGPRSTPSYDHGKVYVYSARMVLKCMDANDGHQIWTCDIIKEHAGKNIHWESAASPLVEGDLVYVVGGGEGQGLLAFDKNDGHVVWKAEDDKMTHSTPIATTILGKRQIIFFTQSGLVAAEPKTGEVLWRYHFPYKVSSAISPVVSGDVVYCSAAYGVGSSACKIVSQDGKFAAQQLWMQSGSKAANHWSTPVCKDGFIYGIFDQAKFGTAPLECIDLLTGNVRWKQEGFGPGGCILVDGCVLALTDAGDLVLVKATPAAYTEIARSHVLSGKCWNTASISDGRLYARSTKEGVSLDVAP
jgi:outer membrane protein assembly factor BamB